MIEVRIEQRTGGATMTGRCFFCGERQNTPHVVVAVVYRDGEPADAVACPDCLALSDEALRAEMVAFAGRWEAWAADTRAAARQPIHRPASGVLELERIHALPPRFTEAVREAGGLE